MIKIKKLYVNLTNEWKTYTNLTTEATEESLKELIDMGYTISFQKENGDKLIIPAISIGFIECCEKENQETDEDFYNEIFSFNTEPRKKNKKIDYDSDIKESIDDNKNEEENYSNEMFFINEEEEKEMAAMELDCYTKILKRYKQLIKERCAPRIFEAENKIDKIANSLLMLTIIISKDVSKKLEEKDFIKTYLNTVTDTSYYIASFVQDKINKNEFNQMTKISLTELIKEINEYLKSSFII